MILMRGKLHVNWMTWSFCARVFVRVYICIIWRSWCCTYAPELTHLCACLFMRLCLYCWVTRCWLCLSCDSFCSLCVYVFLFMCVHVCKPTHWHWDLALQDQGSSSWGSGVREQRWRPTCDARNYQACTYEMHVKRASTLSCQCVHLIYHDLSRSRLHTYGEVTWLKTYLRIHMRIFKYIHTHLYSGYLCT